MNANDPSGKRTTVIVESADAGVSRRTASARQLRTRDRVLQNFVRTFVAALAEGRIADAEGIARHISASEVVTHGLVLHDALAVNERRIDMHALFGPETPASLVMLAHARLQVAGDVTALRPRLVAAARAARKAGSEAPADRVRNLSLAAHAALLAGSPAIAVRDALRGADLVLGVEGATTGPHAELLDTAVADLALVLFLTEQVPQATQLWMWLRARHMDPASVALMQADWGLSVVGVTVGVRSLISPVATALLDPAPSASTPLGSTKDPWWAMVQVARAWAALDRLDGRQALEISRAAVTTSATPYLVGPLVLVHTLALIVNGRSTAALEFLNAARATESLEEAEAPDRPWRAAATAMAMAVTGDDLTDALSGFAGYPEMGPVIRAYAAIAQGVGDGAALSLLGTDEPQESNPRLRMLFATVRSIAHLRAGNDGPALAALEEMASIAEIHGVGAWQLIIPDGDLVCLRELAENSGREDLCEALPVHTRVTAAAPRVELTERELQVLTLLQRGMTNAQIAQTLFISPNTAKFHVANLLRRLGVPTREAAAALGSTARGGRPGRASG